MKKRILLINKSFDVGGIQSSMLNLIDAIKDEYEIDVCVFNNNGQLKDRMPPGIRLVPLNKLLQLHGMSVKEAKKLGIPTYLLRVLLSAFCKTFSNRLSLQLALLFQKPLKGYDVAIAYHHEASPSAVVSGFYRLAYQKTDAPIKLGWIHYDPYKILFDDRKNEKYMEKMTRIVCVSQGTAKVFSQRHPHLKVPIDYCYNMQNIDRILHLSRQEMPTAISGEHFNCFSACRFSPQKDIPRAVRALAPTLKSHPDVRWYIAGEGAELSEVKQLITEYGLEESVILLGSLSNPYPYFANCDLYIQPSIYEAAPMVYGEAMICKIPILTTDNISAQEMVPSAFGIICENSEEGLKNSFAQIIGNRGMVAEMKKNLEANEYSNQGILEKLDSLFT